MAQSEIPWYHSDPRIGSSIADLLVRQGDIQAQRAQQVGNLWANAVGNVGNIAAGAVQQHQEQKQQSKRDAALMEFVNSGVWASDPQAAVTGAVRILGPSGVKFAEGLISVAQLKDAKGPEDIQKRLPMVARGFLAAPDSVKPTLWQPLRGMLEQMGATKPGALPDYSPELVPMIREYAGKEEAKLVSVAPNATLFDPEKKEAVYTAPAAPKEERPDARSLDARYADAVAQGDTTTAQTLLAAKGRLEAAGRAPKSDEPKPLTATAESNIINRLSNQFTAAVKPARELMRQAGLMDQGLEAARRGDLAAGSQAVLVTFQKILDPTSVVRESEYARSASGQALLARIKGAAEKLVSGGAGVPISELEKFAKLAHEMTANVSKSVKATSDRIGKTADRYNIPRELVLEEVDTAPPVEASGPPPTRPKNVPATYKWNPSVRRWRP